MSSIRDSETPARRDKFISLARADIARYASERISSDQENYCASRSNNSPLTDYKLVGMLITDGSAMMASTLMRWSCERMMSIDYETLETAASLPNLNADKLGWEELSRFEQSQNHVLRLYVESLVLEHQFARCMASTYVALLICPVMLHLSQQGDHNSFCILQAAYGRFLHEQYDRNFSDMRGFNSDVHSRTMSTQKLLERWRVMKEDTAKKEEFLEGFKEDLKQLLDQLPEGPALSTIFEIEKGPMATLFSDA